MGLLKSSFVNLELRRLSAETSHEFLEWCGLLDGSSNPFLGQGDKLMKNDLYFVFTEDYPDYGPKSKMTVSRQKFNKWLVSYSQYKYKCQPLEGRDQGGKWIEFVSKDYHETQTTLV
jgi:hypothetical protein